MFATTSRFTLLSSRMMKSALWSLLTVAGLASAHTQRLLVSSYKPVDPNVTVGAIQTLEFDAESGNGSLKLLHSNYDCRRDPTWLDLSLGDNTVLCLDEAIYGEAFGHLTKLAIQPDGSLKSLSSIDTNVGPVSLAIFRNKSSIALASVSHYCPKYILIEFWTDKHCSMNHQVSALMTSRPIVPTPLSPQTKPGPTPTLPSTHPPSGRTSTKPSWIPQANSSSSRTWAPTDCAS